MARYALVAPGDGIVRISTDVDPSVATKPGYRWLSCPVVAFPSFDNTSETVDGPTYQVGELSVTEVWTKRSLTAQELSDRKDAKITNLSNATLLQVVLTLENDNRLIKAKVNQLITDTAASTTKFPAGQAAQVDLAQLKTALKALI